MGTRALTNIFDGDTLLVSIYRQGDGYLEGHGADIKEAVGGRKLVNGITGDYSTVANGMGCFAALLIAHLKNDMEAGNIYVDRPRPDGTEEWTYTLRGSTMKPEDGVSLHVSAYDQVIYDGPLSEFDPNMAMPNDEDDGE